MQARGVGRIQADVTPTNGPSLRMLLSLGYVVTGSTSSERWGNCVQLTRFLREEAAEVFARQFCAFRSEGSQSNTSTRHTLERSTP